MSQEKILQRVRKLLAMADQTVSPEEAVVAAQKARKLMDEHNLTRDDIPEDEGQFARKVAGHPFKSYPIWMQTIAINIAKMNDCVVDYENTGPYRNSPRYIRFSGFKSDAIIAGYMFDYLVKNGERIATGETRQTRGAFLAGYASGVYKQINEIIQERITEKNKDARAMIIDRKAVVARKFKGARVVQRNSRTTETDAADRGRRAGRNTSLNQQVNGAKTRQNIGA